MVQKVFRCKLSGKKSYNQGSPAWWPIIVRSFNIYLGWRIWCRRSSFKCRCPKAKSCASEDNDNKETSSKIYSSIKSSSNCKTHDCSYQWCWWLSTNCTIQKTSWRIERKTGWNGAIAWITGKGKTDSDPGQSEVDWTPKIISIFRSAIFTSKNWEISSLWWLKSQERTLIHPSIPNLNLVKYLKR